MTRFDAVKQRAFAWGMFSAQNLFSSDALLNGATNDDGRCPDQIEEVRVTLSSVSAYCAIPCSPDARSRDQTLTQLRAYVPTNHSWSACAVR